MPMSNAPSAAQLVFLMKAALLILLAWTPAVWIYMYVAHLSGEAGGFALRNNWLLSQFLHEDMKRALWLLIAGLCLTVGWPVGPLARLARSQRLQLVVSTLVAALTVSMLKQYSATSCSWDLSDFGGVAHYVSHWTRLADGGSGNCFPAGHAASGFAFVGGYFVFKETAPSVAGNGLGGAAIAGLVLGLAQQMRGAHFMSHTLWTAWICWVISFAIDAVWRLSVRLQT